MPAVMLACAVLVAWPALARQAAQTPGSAKPAPGVATVPAARSANRVAVIPIKGPIDEWTEYSVRKRIAEAETQGADALVFDIDTPGGEMLACLAISRHIKSTSVPITVAWVNPNAISAGAVISLACKSIVVTTSSTLGDALPIEIHFLEGVKPLPDAEREKILGPIMADLVDSARRNGYDEMLVQGFVRRGVELWLVEHTETGERLFVTHEQYLLAVGDEPARGAPVVPAITGPADTSASGAVPSAAPVDGAPTGAGPSDGTAFIPGSPNVAPHLKQEVDLALSLKGTLSKRPNLRSPGHAGKYVPVEYVASGAGVLTLQTAALKHYRLADSEVNTPAELQAYFGSPVVSTMPESWSVGLARFLSSIYVRGLLIAIFLIAMFIEMTHPGLVLPAAIAAVALGCLLAPLIIVDLSAWWMGAAIIVGVLLIVIELFLLPGTILVGAGGVLLVFGGLIGVAMGGPANLFPGSGRTSEAHLGLIAALVSIVAAIITMYFIGKHMTRVPFLNKLVLTGAHGDSELKGTLLETQPAGPLSVGDVGVALTPLRPAGRVEVGDEVVDAVCLTGFADAGAKVRIVEVSAFRVGVEPYAIS